MKKSTIDKKLVKKINEFVSYEVYKMNAIDNDIQYYSKMKNGIIVSSILERLRKWHDIYQSNIEVLNELKRMVELSYKDDIKRGD